MADDVVKRDRPIIRPVVDDLKSTDSSTIIRWAKKVSEAIGVLTGDVAKTNDSLLDSAVTFRDLIESKIAVRAPKVSGRLIDPPSEPTLQTPPAPTGLTVTRLPYAMRLEWNAPTYEGHQFTEIWRHTSDSLSLATAIASVPTVSFYEDGFVSGVGVYYWIRFINKSDLKGPFNSISGTSDSKQPGDVTNLTYSLDKFVITLRWNPVVEEDLDGYEIRLGNVYATAQSLGLHKTTYFNYPVQVAGTYRFWVRAKDIYGFYSGTAASVDVVISAPIHVTISAQFVGSNLILSWSESSGSFAIDRYEIRRGSTYSSAVVIGNEYTRNHQIKADWLGDQRFWVTPVDVAGNFGTPSFYDVSVQAPGMVASLTSEVIDNNVLLRWQPPTTGSLPIETYEILKGNTLPTASQIGDKSGLFTTVFEQAAGTYTYWVRARDTAGNVGQARSVTAFVNQPPDYVLYSDLNVSLMTVGTLSSAIREIEKIVLPVNTSETWAQHFTSRSWGSPQDQINANYPIYIQPTPSSGYYEIEIDYGAVVPSTTINVTPTYSVVAGSPSYFIEISYKVNIGDPYTGPFTGDSYFVPSGFRYVRVRFNASPTTDRDIITLSALNVRLNTKQKRLSGYGNVGVGGTRFVLTADGNEFVKTGNNTSGQNTITSISTTNLAVGMSVEGPGIQGGTVITAIGTNQVTLNQVTTQGSSGGTYRFGVAYFVDLFGPPLVQASGTTPKIPVVDFVDAPYPLSFVVYLFDQNGAQTTGTVSWQGVGV